MKRIESGLAKLKWVVVAIIVMIFMQCAYTLYTELTAGNFIETPQVTMNDVMAESEKHKVLVVFFEKDDEDSKVLNRAMNGQTKQIVVTDGTPIEVKIDINSTQGKKLSHELNVTQAPAIVPVWQRSTAVTINGDTSQMLAPQVVSNTEVNKEMLDSLFTGIWKIGA